MATDTEQGSPGRPQIADEGVQRDEEETRPYDGGLARLELPGTEPDDE